MCEPTTIMMGVGLAMGAMSMAQQGRAANAAARSNAAMMRQQSKDAADRGQVEEMKVRRKGAAMKGDQIAQLAANGIEISTGSASDLIADTEMMTELDALTIRSNTERDQYFHEFSARSELAQGSNAQQQGNFSAAGSLISGAAQVNSSWTKYQASQTKTTDKIVP